MICSNRKTRVFDPTGHETSIAHVSLMLVTTLLPLLQGCPQNLADFLTERSSLEHSPWYASHNFSLLPNHVYACSKSNDDHSYFVRWKLPTEA